MASDVSVKVNLRTLRIVLLALLVALVLLNFYLLNKVGVEVSARSLLLESAKPVSNELVPASVPQVSLTLLTDSGCSDCRSASAIAGQIVSGAGKFGISIVDTKSLEYTSSEAKAFIQKYNVTKIPALLVSKEASESGQLVQAWASIGTVESDGVLVLRLVQPPYVDLATGRVTGRVNVTVLSDSSCTACFNVSRLVSQIKGLGVSIVNESSFDANSARGAELIREYNVTKIPAIIISKDVRDYSSLRQSFSSVGDYAPDGSFVLRKPVPPYFDLTENRTVGLLTLIRLVDSNCSICYNASLHANFLKQNNAVIQNETVLDVAGEEGLALARKYNVSFVPTVLISPDVQAYSSSGLEEYLQLGSFEDDGWFVFRQLEALQANYTRVAGNAGNNSSFAAQQKT